jgi:hypothetical protein
MVVITRRGAKTEKRKPFREVSARPDRKDANPG